MEREMMEKAVKHTGAAVKDTATEALTSAERATRRAGEALESAGETLRQHLPGTGGVSDAAEALSQGVRQTGQYLREEGMSGIMEDLEVLIRRYPLQALLLGAGFGFLLSRIRP
jgi:hypothetical protein